MSKEYMDALQAEVKLRNFIGELRALRSRKPAGFVDNAIARLTAMANRMRRDRMLSA